MKYKTVKKVPAGLLALCLAASLLLCCGCGGPNRDDEPETEAAGNLWDETLFDAAEVGTEPAEADESGLLDLTGSGYTRLSYSRKMALRNDIAGCLLRLYTDSKSYHDHTYSAGIGLFDADRDGTPEVVECCPGGSLGNNTYTFYDIDTAERVVNLDGNTLTAALDGDTLVYLSESEMRIDASERLGYMYKISFDTANRDTAYVALWSTRTRYDEMKNAVESEYTVIDSYEPYILHCNQDSLRGNDNYSGENNRSHSVTAQELDGYIEAFYERVTVIPDSALQIVWWSEIIPDGVSFEDNPREYVRLMTEKLCSTGQGIIYKDK